MPAKPVDVTGLEVDGLSGPRPVGPLRDKITVDISSNDHTDEGGFVFQAAAAGNLTYRTLAGSADQTEALDAGGTVNVGGVMVLLQAVRASSTIDSGVAGKL